MDTTTTLPLFDFHAVYRKYRSDVSGSLRGLGVLEKDVPDANQEVFAVAHRRQNDFAGRSSVRTWLLGICRCVAADYRRRASHRREVFGQTVEPESCGEVSIESTLQGRKVQTMVRSALDVLPFNERRVVELYEFEALSMVEVARHLGCPLQTAYARLYSARRRLRDALRPVQFELCARP